MPTRRSGKGEGGALPPPPPPPRPMPPPKPRDELDPLLPQQLPPQPQPPPPAAPLEQPLQQQELAEPTIEPPQPVQQPMQPEPEPSPAEPVTWTLRVRRPRPVTQPRPSHHLPSFLEHHHPSIISIRITPNMTASTLSLCLQQVLMVESPIHGLFSDDDAVFWPLVDVVTLQPQKVIFSLMPEPQQQRKRRMDPRHMPWWWKQPVIVLIGVVISLMGGFYFYYYFLVAVHPLDVLFYESMTHVHTLLVQEPLLKLYRHGPWPLGWSGDSLPHMCATWSSLDTTFWDGHMLECERLYHRKWTAFLMISQPIYYVLLLMLTVTVWHFVPQRQPPQPAQPPMDRDAVETFRALHLLWRQVQRWNRDNNPVVSTTTAGKTVGR